MGYQTSDWHGRVLSLMIMGLLVAAPGCAELESEETEEDLHWVDREQLKELRRIAAGAFLFNHGTFGGNDRTCATCHPSRILREESGTLSPADVEALFQHDPDNALFQHDAADVMGGDTFDRIREHATILIEMPLPPNVRLVGSDARSVILPRGIPTTMNTPALDPVLMYDGRAPDLESQALGAIQGHAQVEGDVPEFALEAIASFQAAVLFNRDNLRRFARKGEPVTIPFGTTESEQRGRRFFIADNTDDPDMVGESPDSKCGWCHSGPMLDGTSAFFSENIAPIPATEGLRFITTLVSEINPLGLPVHDFEFTLPDGSTVVVSSPDPGVALVGGAPGLPFGGLHPNFVGFFKIPTLWGTADTAPYFHDNSSKTIEELMDHYDLALFLLSSNNPRNPPIIDLTEQEKADIAAYLRLL